MEVITFNKNDTATGVVTSIKKYGAFLSFQNGYIGLLHISELSEGFVKSIYDYCNIGDSMKLKILEVDENNKFLTVSLKKVEGYVDKGLISKKMRQNKKRIHRINFTKLEESLGKMISDELEREKL